MRKKIHNTSRSTLLSIAVLLGSINSFAQTDSNNTTLRYPIEDRNTDFFITKPKTTLDLKDPKIIDKKVEYDPQTQKYVLYEKIGDAYYKTPT